LRTAAQDRELGMVDGHGVNSSHDVTRPLSRHQSQYPNSSSYEVVSMIVQAWHCLDVSLPSVQ
jgi:hypothetical protein